MDNTTNDLDLKFYVHAYGSQIGDLYVYIDDSSTSNHSSATLLASYTTFQDLHQILLLGNKKLLV